MSDPNGPPKRADDDPEKPIVETKVEARQADTQTSTWHILYISMTLVIVLLLLGWWLF